MRVTQQPAYVLHTRPWRETSLLVEAFTADFGRVGLLARGVRSARARLPRAALEPLQALRLAWSGRGELHNLGAVEPVGRAYALHGDRLLAALYVNELLVRLTARDDPSPHLFARYALLLDDLAGPAALPWSLRRFERDLLATIGFALQLTRAADSGDVIDPERRYDYVPGQGAVAPVGRPAGVSIRGSALLALAADAAQPDPEDMASLRRLMRALIAAHAGERGLQSWRVLAGPFHAG